MVFFVDQEHTRISKDFSNVGTQDWMPAWALNYKIEDVKPTFDVFALGKLLWAMVSGLPVLTLWYFDRPKFNLEEMFPNAPYVHLANQLFKKCLVELEENCLSDATALLHEVDKALRIIECHADLIGDNIVRTCKVCGIGKYVKIIDKDRTELEDFGLNPEGREFESRRPRHEHKSLSPARWAFLLTELRSNPRKSYALLFLYPSEPQRREFLHRFNTRSGREDF